LSERPRGPEPVKAKACERNAVRSWLTARGFKPVDINRELPAAAQAGTLEVTKRGIRELHRVTEFEYKRAGGTAEDAAVK